MKKWTILIIIAIVLALVLYQFAFKKKGKISNKEIAMSVADNDTLTGDIGLALQAYYNLKDAFVKSDTALVNQEAKQFVVQAEAISIKAIDADPTVLELAAQLQKDISRQTKELIAAAGIEAKRKSFQPVSDGLFDLLRSIRYSGSKVYQQFCPMAFNNAGAAWLSKSSEVINPYFGDKMLNCGDVRDSVNIVKK